MKNIYSNGDKGYVRKSILLSTTVLAMGLSGCKTTDIGILSGLAANEGCRAVAGDSLWARIGCVGAGYLFAKGTMALSDKIKQNLAEKDQRKALAATTEALHTGQMVKLDLPDSEAVLTVSTEGDAQPKVIKAEILVANAELSYYTDQLTVVGASYQATSDTKFFSKPNSEESVGSLDAGSKVHVFGSTSDGKYYLVGHGVESAFAGVEPVAIGFAPTSSFSNPTLAKAGEAALIDIVSIPESAISSAEFSWQSGCKVTNFSIQKSGEEEPITDTATSCTGPSGIPLTA